ncbi:hypothetical protein CSUI_006643, partial [Cystoisospora suis]
MIPRLGGPSNGFMLEKEVYEYIPDPALSLAPQDSESSLSVGSSSSTTSGPLASHHLHRPSGMRTKSVDIDDDPIEAGVAYETFRGKTYKTTQFDKGFTKQPTTRRRKTMRDFETSIYQDFDHTGTHPAAAG